MYYHKITDHKMNLIRSFYDNCESINNSNNFSFDELTDVDLYLFSYNKNSDIIRLIYLKNTNENNITKYEHWEIFVSKKNNVLTVSKKINSEIKIPLSACEIFDENHSPQHAPIYRRITLDIELGYYNEQEALSMTRASHIKNLLSFTNIDNIYYLDILKNVLNTDNSGSISIKNLDNGCIKSSDYVLYQRNEENLSKATKFKELLEELINGQNIFSSKNVRLKLYEIFCKSIRHFIVYKDGLYYSITYESHVDDMFPPPFYNVITAKYSKSFDIMWNSISDNIKCEILMANYISALDNNNL